MIVISALDMLVHDILHATMDHGERCCVKYEPECIGHDRDNKPETIAPYVKQLIRRYVEELRATEEKAELEANHRQVNGENRAFRQQLRKINENQ